MVDVGKWLTEDTGCKGTEPGLFVTGDKAKAVPLRSRHVRAVLHCDLAFAETTEELSYLADADATVTFKFPVPSRAAVYCFEATIGDRKIVTETKRKAEAEQEYSHAVQQGHTAVLAKQAAGSIYSVELGNLEAHTECVIRLSYLRQLDRAAGVLEYAHTATWVPPYVTSQELSNGADSVADNNPKFASKVSYSLTYDVRIDSSAPPASVTSPSHNDVLQSSVDGASSCITASKEVSDPSLDFVLLVELPEEAAGAARSRLELQRCVRGDAKKLIAQATFVPGAQEDSGPAPPRELWLVIDGSGSMGGAPEAQARDAASFFVKDLPQSKGVKFNLVMFGSSHQMMWPEAREVSDAHTAEAESWVQGNVNAHWGGTEILGALKAVFAVPISKGHQREIIFCTDGGVSGVEEDRIKSLVKTSGSSSVSSVKKVLRNLLPGGKQAAAPALQQPAAAGSTACHVLGIGHGVHRSFLDDIASLSGGVAQYVVDGEDVAVKAGFLKKCALNAGALSRPRLVTKNCLLAPAPAVLPPRLFPGEPLLILAQVLKREPGAMVGLKVSRPDGSELDIELPLDVENATNGDAFAVLHAMCSVGALLDGRSALHLQPDGVLKTPAPQDEVVKDEVVRLAVEENLVTPHTASVGVLLQSSPLDPSKSERHEVPLQVPHGRKLWQPEPVDYGFFSAAVPSYAFGGGGAPGAPQCMAAPAPMMPPPPLAYGAPIMRCAAAPKKSSSFFAGFSRSRTVAGSTAPSVASAAPSGGADGCRAAAAFSDDKHRQDCAASPDADDLLTRGEQEPGLQNKAASLAQSAEAFIRPGAGSLAPAHDLKEGSADDSSIVEATEQAMSHVQNPGAVSATKSPPAPLDTRSVLRQLNLLRTADGVWDECDALLSLLAGLKGTSPGAEGAAALRAAKPQAATPDSWATVLVLAALRARLRGEQALWSDWEERATAWLKSHWPAAAGSPGVAIIGAMKLV